MKGNPAGIDKLGVKKNLCSLQKIKLITLFLLSQSCPSEGVVLHSGSHTESHSASRDKLEMVLDAAEAIESEAEGAVEVDSS